MLNTTAKALDWVIDQGYNPTLGARALKRAIEKELTRPIAIFLAANGASGIASTATSDTAASESTSNRSLDLMLIDIDRADCDVEAVEIASRKTLADGEDSKNTATTSAAQASGRSLVTRSTGGLTVAVRLLKSQESIVVDDAPTEVEIASMLSQCHSALEALTRRLPELNAGSQFNTGRLSPEQTRYLLVQDELPRLRVWHEELHEELRARQHSSATGAISRPGKTSSVSSRTIRRKGPSHGNVVNRSAADDEIDDFLETRFDGPGRDVDLNSETPCLLARCRWIQNLALLPEDRLETSVTLRIYSLDPTFAPFMERFTQRLLETWSDELGLESTLVADAAREHGRTISVKGVLADHYARLECGFHAMMILGMPSPKLLAVHRMEEPVPERIVRKRFIESRDSSTNWPTVEELRNIAWNSIDMSQQ